VSAIVRRLQDVKRKPPGLDGLEQSLSDIYYGNFSVFQSLPDVWAIDQIFRHAGTGRRCRGQRSS
jgi:arginine decarboxylase